MANPRRLISIETLKQGESLWKQAHEDQAFANYLMRAATESATIKHWQDKADASARAWADWALLYAGDIMIALKAFAALEEILDHTWITELVWWNTPGAWGSWGLKTDTDQVGEGEGEWEGTELHEVLCAAAADFAGADEFDEDSSGSEVRDGVTGSLPAPKGERAQGQSTGAIPAKPVCAPNDPKSPTTPRPQALCDICGHSGMLSCTHGGETK